VFGSPDEAREWLSAPQLRFDRRTPIEVAATGLGERMVERILTNIEYDLPA